MCPIAAADRFRLNSIGRVQSLTTFTLTPYSLLPAMASHCIIPNTDISGIGVRTAAYAQNLLSFVPAVLALIDHQISQKELDSLEGQSTTILLSSYALLIAGLILARNQLDNYHTTIVLNLNWMNNTNTFIYILFLLHADRNPWSRFQSRRRAGKEPKAGMEQDAKSLSAKLYVAIRKRSLTLASIIDSVDPAVLIGSLHLSLMGALGLWLWIAPGRFGNSLSCSLESTISLFGRAIPLSSHALRAVSLSVYILILVPGLNLILPTVIFCAPLVLVRRLTPKVDESKQVDGGRPVQLILNKLNRREIGAILTGLLMLMFVNLLFIVDTELSISRNESLQDRQDGLWTFGQTLALLLLVLPLWNIAAALRIIDGPEDPKRVAEAAARVAAIQAEAVRGLEGYTSSVEWEKVKQWIHDIQGAKIVPIGGKWIHAAVKNDDQDVIAFAGNYHKNLNEQDNHGTTSLDYALKSNRLKLVVFLRKNGGDLDASSQLNKKSLHYASEGGLDVVQYVVSENLKLDINSKDAEDKTGLHYASINGYLDVVKYLVREGMVINNRDKFGRISLHYSSRNGHLEIVQYLVEKNVGTDDDENDTPGGLERSANVATQLGEPSSDVNATDENEKTALHHAAEGNHLNVVKYLLTHSAEIEATDEDGKTGLHIATQSGHLRVIECLVENGAKINGRGPNGTTSLHIACGRKRLDITTFLVNNRADVKASKTDGVTSLWIASENGALDVVRLLVQKNADIENPGKKGDTSVCIASRNGHRDVVKLLSEKNANIEASNNNGATSLYIASQEGHLNVVKHLLEKNANIEASRWHNQPLYRFLQQSPQCCKAPAGERHKHRSQ
ncbi:ankyrin repeat-containing domain protein [Mycena metata]|uniref:Ankyrin repeat-containing domain protein n=1 Tax=Mycena metata TaxID=1033252 RepID=A0AAD7MUZ3_9AGAR|nr:ankyrin repeat-containing domain protein [Mycena metata]